MRKNAFFCFLVLFSTANAQPLNVKIEAKSAILYNPDNGAILFQKRAKEPYYPASILKIATALFVLDQKNVDLHKKCVASKKALAVMNAEVKQADPLSYPSYIIEHDGVTMGVEEEKAYSLENLLHGLLLVSGNDAANVIAENFSGSIPKFMDELNNYLQKKGIFQTRFQNPHGLHHPAQMTTAYDMALIAGLAFENASFCQIVTTSSYELEDGKILVNTNPLLKEGQYKYAKYIGGKTGFTSSAGHNLVAAAEHKGRKLIVVLLGCERSGDRFKDAISLFEAAFCEKEEKRLLFTKDHECFHRRDEKTSQILKAGLCQDVDLLYFPSEESDLNAKLVWNKLKSPVQLGEVVGKLVVENDRGKELAAAELFAGNEIDKMVSFHWGWWILGIVGIFGSFQFFKKFRKIIKR